MKSIIFKTKLISKGISVGNFLEIKNYNKFSIGDNSSLGKLITLKISKHSEINIGENCNIESLTILEAQKGNIIIGNNFSLNQFSVIRAYGNVSIGDGVRIGPATQIMSVNHIFEDKNKYIYEQGIKGEGIIIGNNVWIGSNTLILDGVKIGNNSIIGAGSLISKDVPENVLIVGNPQRIIRKLEFDVN
jgi:acetyltransferase-like isoleucine patch superfamily enzyme